MERGAGAHTGSGDRHRLRRVPRRPRRATGPDHRSSRRMKFAPPRRLLRSVTEGVSIAFDALRSNKLRSALTILGVVIGVTTVMAMASIVQGVRSQIFNSIEVAGPTTFYVLRYWSQTPVDPNNLPYEVRIRPVLRSSDAAAIHALPE